MDVSRGSMYYKSQPKKDNSSIMEELRVLRLQMPSYGYRRMTVALREKGFLVNHKKVQALRKSIGLSAIYPQKKTTIKNQQHTTFSYLLRGLVINHPNQVWQVDITYIKIRGGFVYLVGIVDVFSKKIMGWKLSTFLDAQACLEALSSALKQGIPEIINSDQGCQFTGDAWVGAVRQYGIQISMDGKGRWADNVHIERLWRTIKYELVYLYSFDTVQQIREALDDYIAFYNARRYHSKLNYHTPNAVFFKKTIPSKKDLFDSFFISQHHQQRSAMF